MAPHQQHHLQDPAVYCQLHSTCQRKNTEYMLGPCCMKPMYTQPKSRQFFTSDVSHPHQPSPKAALPKSIVPGYKKRTPIATLPQKNTTASLPSPRFSIRIILVFIAHHPISSTPLCCITTSALKGSSTQLIGPRHLTLSSSRSSSTATPTPSSRGCCRCAAAAWLAACFASTCTAAWLLCCFTGGCWGARTACCRTAAGPRCCLLPAALPTAAACCCYPCCCCHAGAQPAHVVC